MDNNQVDLSNGLGYNTGNDIHDAVVENYLTRPILVKMDEQKVLNDTSCRHEELVPDPTDTLGEAIYYGCTNRECGVGFYRQPMQK